MYSWARQRDPSLYEMLCGMFYKMVVRYVHSSSLTEHGRFTRTEHPPDSVENKLLSFHNAKVASPGYYCCSTETARVGTDAKRTENDFARAGGRPTRHPAGAVTPSARPLRRRQDCERLWGVNIARQRFSKGNDSTSIALRA